MCSDEEMQQKCESCSVTEMEQKLRLCVFMTLLEGECFTYSNISDGQSLEIMLHLKLNVKCIQNDQNCNKMIFVYILKVTL